MQASEQVRLSVPHPPALVKLLVQPHQEKSPANQLLGSPVTSCPHSPSQPLHLASDAFEQDWPSQFHLGVFGRWSEVGGVGGLWGLLHTCHRTSMPGDTKSTEL